MKHKPGCCSATQSSSWGLHNQTAESSWPTLLPNVGKDSLDQIVQLKYPAAHYRSFEIKTKCVKYLMGLTLGTDWRWHILQVIRIPLSINLCSDYMWLDELRYLSVCLTLRLHFCISFSTMWDWGAHLSSVFKFSFRGLPMLPGGWWGRERRWGWFHHLHFINTSDSISLSLSLHHRSKCITRPPSMAFNSPPAPSLLLCLFFLNYLAQIFLNKSLILSVYTHRVCVCVASTRGRPTSRLRD